LKDLFASMVHITRSHGSASVVTKTKQVNGKGQNLTPLHAETGPGGKFAIPC